jgi:hypothetical protein
MASQNADADKMFLKQVFYGCVRYKKPLKVSCDSSATAMLQHNQLTLCCTTDFPPEFLSRQRWQDDSQRLHTLPNPGLPGYLSAGRARI